MKSIRLAKDFSVPVDVCTSAIGVVGIRGSGKSTTAGVLVEGAIDAGVPAAVIDPTGGWYGLKSSADGKSPGLPVYVFGGEHGDLPLDPDAGDIVGQFVVQRRVPIVLDLSLMRKGQRTRFVADFLERVYHDNREPLLVAIDEAAQFVPQSARGLMSPEIGRCIGAVDDIAALGRRRGLGVVLIGQRAARINKDVLTQCHTLVVMQTTGAPDRKALDEWVKEQHGSDDAERTFLRELTTLRVGEGFVWSPALLQVFRKVRFNNRRTFDSSRTPRIGETQLSPSAFADVDLTAMSVEIRALAAKADEEDPRRLRARIAELENQLQQTRAERPSAAGIDASVVATLERHSEAIVMAIRGLRPPLEPAPHPTSTGTVPSVPRSPAAAQKPAQRALRAGQRRMLQTLARCGGELTKQQLATLADVNRGSGTFSDYIRELVREGLVEDLARSVRLFDTGATAVGEAIRSAPPPTSEVVGWYSVKLRAGERRMLRILVDNYPKDLTKQDLAERADVNRLSGTFSDYLRRLKSNGLADDLGRRVRASETLFMRQSCRNGEDLKGGEVVRRC